MLPGLTSLRPDVRPGEARETLGAFLTLFGMMAGHSILETARDALFLSHLAPARLPWVYLGMAVLLLLGTVTRNWIPRRIEQRDVAGAALMFAAAGTLLFWVLLRRDAHGVLFAFYMWTGIASTLMLVRYWMLVEDTFTVTQAKRLFPVIGVGSVAGAIAGSALARALSAVLPARHLVLAGGVVLAITAVLPQLAPHIRRPGQAVSTRVVGGPASNVLRLVGQQPYLLRVALLVLLSSVALTMADYLFKSMVAARVPGPQLSEYFSTVYLALNVASLVTQIALVGWVVRTLGINRAILVLPALLAAASGAVLASGAMAAVLALKGVDGSLRHTLHRTSSEMLYVPLSADLRALVKGPIDALGQRGGQALASLVILTAVMLNDDPRLIAGLILAVAAAWVGLAVTLRPHYLQLFRTMLRDRGIRASIEFPQLDLSSLENLFAALNSRNDAEVIAAMELLADQGRTRLIPTLILYHPSTAVVVRALELFAAARRDDFIAIGHRLLQHDDAEVRAATLRAWSAVKPDESLLGASYSDPSPMVRSTALVGLVAAGWLAVEEAQEALRDELQRGDEEGLLALARAIRRQPSPLFQPALVQLVESQDPRVALEAVLAMRAQPGPEFLPALLRLLPRRQLRAAVRETLVAIGEPALRALDATLADPKVPPAVRRHVPRTLIGFAPHEAVAVLSRHLLDHPDGVVRYKSLRALGRLRFDHPDLPLDRALLDRALAETIRGAFRTMEWRAVLEQGAREEPRRATPVQGLLVTLLRDKEQHAVERLFRLLALRHNSEDFGRVHTGLMSRSRATRDSSRELLENLVPPPLREPLLALVDDGPAEQRLEYSRPYYVPSRPGYEGVLHVLLHQKSEPLCGLAVYHVEELRLPEFADVLQEVDAPPSSFLASTIARAVELLKQPADARERLRFQEDGVR